MINGKDFKTFLQSPTEYDKFCMKYYKKSDIESMFSEVAKFHNFFQKKEISGRQPFFQLIAEDYITLTEKLIRNSIIPEFLNFNFDKYFTLLNQNILELYSNITGFKNVEISKIDKNELINIKTKYLKSILSKYDIKNFDINKFDVSIYNNTGNISEDDIFLGRKIILLESLLNINDQKEIFKSILNYLVKLKDKIPEILSLPETITHNDIHPLNFLKGENWQIFLVDFDRAGKNKRICDLGLTFTTNNIEDESILYSIIAGYRKYNTITHKELKLIYDFYILSYLTSIVREIDEMKFENFRTIKHIFDPKKWFEKIKKFETLSLHNNLPSILDDVIETGLDGLDLATRDIKNQTKTFQQKILKLRLNLKNKIKEI
ncbi:MAG TPA: phosphotransferase [Rickettsiales bacterium]|nr:phosphotransferase [Rickettsiales bacterium]